VAGFVPDGYRASHVPLQTLFTAAFGLRGFQITGAPVWTTSEQWDVEAKMDPATADAVNALPPDQRKLAQQQMLQSLLAGRFALKWRAEVKDGPVYFLVVAKNGPKLKPADPKNADPLLGPDGGGISGYIRIGRGEGGNRQYIATSVSMPYLARVLSSDFQRPVVDKTGLTGIYDFTLEFRRDDLPVASSDNEGADAGAIPTATVGSSLLSALEGQIGLKLESGCGPVETVVIDHVERPSAN
jgi:uncharacterized protein (TIGR03435 family)